MSALAWWIIPAVATLLAIAYVSWRARPRPPEDTHDAIQAREAFKRVIEDDLRVRGSRPRLIDGDGVEIEDPRPDDSGPTRA